MSKFRWANLIVTVALLAEAVPQRGSSTGSCSSFPALPPLPEADPCHPEPLTLPRHRGITTSVVSPVEGSTVKPDFVVKAKVEGLPEDYRVWTMLQVAGPAEHPTFAAHDCMAGAVIWPGPLALVQSEIR